jgi:hypothetical protein
VGTERTTDVGPPATGSMWFMNVTQLGYVFAVVGDEVAWSIDEDVVVLVLRTTDMCVVGIIDGRVMTLSASLWRLIQRRVAMKRVA